MMIKRRLLPLLQKDLTSGKILILYGPRQVGKTTLVKELLKDREKTAYFLCDEPDIRGAFTNKTSTEMKAFIGDATTIVLDEAQRVENIGIALKLLHDVFPHITVIATGSSSFDLANKIIEPLTGRTITRILYPITYGEYAEAVGVLEAKRSLGALLKCGMYPAVLTSANPESEVRRLGAENLFKDVFRVEGIRKPIVIEQLLALLSHQVGSEVSYNEIAQKLEVSRATVIAYMRLLEHAYIIYRVPALGRNKRDEVTRFDKVFFYDTGIRNSLIGTFTSTESRADVGALFENFFITERRKLHEYHELYTKQYFWRTKDGSEIDLVEETDGALKAFECKWREEKNITRAWHTQFPEVPVALVNKRTFVDFL